MPPPPARYVTSLASARRVLAILDANGVRKNADIQWNDGSCGRIVQLQPHATPWSLLVRTSQGGMRKTGAIRNHHPIPRLRFDPQVRLPQCGVPPSHRSGVPPPDPAAALRPAGARAVPRLHAPRPVRVGRGQGLCVETRWNMTHCPTLCGHAVCRSAP